MNRVGLPFGRRRAAKAPELLAAARSGDGQARERLIHDYTPFVLRVASQAAGRYLQVGVDEEYSIGLLAFNEAIDAYDPGKGAFLSFAQTVIRRRLIDYFRQRHHRPPETSLEAEAEGEAEGHASPALEQAARRAWSQHEETWQRSEEIAEFRRILRGYDIELADLARACPKHADTRARVLRVAHRLAEDAVLAGSVVKHKVLPLRAMAGLLADTGVSRKTVERHRKYLMAVFLLLVHDFPYLKAYVEASDG